MTQTLITRKAWGARYPDGFRSRPMPVSEYWLHHSETIAPDLVQPFDDDDAAVRHLEDIGEQRFGGGISYTYPVTPVGRIYEGVSLPRQGAHTYGHNTVGAAFVLVGSYVTHEPTEAQRDAIARRMVIDHRAGNATRHTLNGGHRDASGNSTECPGAKGEAAIPDINKRAEALWAAGYPAVDPTSKEYDTMATASEIAQAVWAEMLPVGTTGRERSAGWQVGYTNQLLQAVVGQTDPAKLAAALAPGIASALTAEGVSGAVTEAALEGALRKVLGSLDDTGA